MVRAVIFDMFETLVTHYRVPLYFGTEMAEDAGIDVPLFLELWRSTADERSVGKLSLEATLEMILSRCGAEDTSVIPMIVEKRLHTKRECFKRIHHDIMPMLDEARSRGMLIGLISNCFSEEVKAIRESALMPMFDAVMLSYEQGVMKPDREIFRRCTEALGVPFDECIYIGDGGSGELEAARDLGMTALRAGWYLPPEAEYSEDFMRLDEPMDVIKYL